MPVTCLARLCEERGDLLILNDDALAISQHCYYTRQYTSESIPCHAWDELLHSAAQFESGNALRMCLSPSSPPPKWNVAH